MNIEHSSFAPPFHLLWDAKSEVTHNVMLLQHNREQTRHITSRQESGHIEGSEGLNVKDYGHYWIYSLLKASHWTLLNS